MTSNKMTIEDMEKEYEKINKQRDSLGKAINEMKKEEEKKKQAELTIKKDKRKKEVEDAITKAVELIKQYIEDYGSFSITDHANDLAFLFGSKPWRWFL